MICIHIPSFDSEADALDWIHVHYEPIRICLLRGYDGLIRGTALVRTAAK